MNAKLPNGQYLIPSDASSGAGDISIGVPNVTLLGTSTLVADQATARVDYDVTKTDRLSAKYYYQNDPVNKPYGFSQTGRLSCDAEQWCAGLRARQHDHDWDRRSTGSSGWASIAWDRTASSGRRCQRTRRWARTTELASGGSPG